MHWIWSNIYKEDQTLLFCIKSFLQLLSAVFAFQRFLQPFHAVLANLISKLDFLTWKYWWFERIVDIENARKSIKKIIVVEKITFVDPYCLVVFTLCGVESFQWWRKERSAEDIMRSCTFCPIALCTKSNGRYDIEAEKEKNKKVKVVKNQIFGHLQHPKNEVRYLENIFLRL